MKIQNDKNFTPEDQQRLFQSGKLDGCRKTIFDLITRLRFAREMCSIAYWSATEAEAHALCYELASLGTLSKAESEILLENRP